MDHKKLRSIQGNVGIKVPGEDAADTRYSYSWWIDEFNQGEKTTRIIHASGWGGQKIMVIPDVKTVVVFTGGNYTKKLRQFRLLENYLLPSM